MSMHTHFWGKKTLSDPPFLCAVYRLCFYGLREIACSSGPLPQGDSGSEALGNKLKRSLDVVMGESRPLPGSGGLLPCAAGVTRARRHPVLQCSVASVCERAAWPCLLSNTFLTYQMGWFYLSHSGVTTWHTADAHLVLDLPQVHSASEQSQRRPVVWEGTKPCSMSHVLTSSGLGVSVYCTLNKSNGLTLWYKYK